MLKGTLKIKGTEGGIVLDLPETLGEVRLNRYIDFLTENEAIGNPDENQILALAKCVGAFLGIDLPELLRAEVGDVFQKEYKGLDGGLSSLYGYIGKLVGASKPELRSQESAFFSYKGQRFQIPFIAQQAIAGDVLLPDIEVVEAIEAAEIQRVTYQSLKTIVVEPATRDQRGGLYYSMYLRLLAVLARKEGDRLPTLEAERERWINDRAVFFQEIDAETALDLDFFLRGILTSSGENPLCVGFLSLRSLDLKVAISLKRGRHSHGRKTKMRRFSKR